MGRNKIYVNDKERGKAWRLRNKDRLSSTKTALKAENVLLKLEVNQLHKENELLKLQIDPTEVNVM